MAIFLGVAVAGLLFVKKVLHWLDEDNEYDRNTFGHDMETIGPKLYKDNRNTIGPKLFEDNVNTTGPTLLGPKVNVRRIGEWSEVDVIGNFLLQLYHGRIIGRKNKWICKTTVIQEKFEELVKPQIRKKLKETSGTDDIVTLLHRCGFVLNSNSTIVIAADVLLKFREKVLNTLDKIRKESHVTEYYEVDYNAALFYTKHYGTLEQKGCNKYRMNHCYCMACYIEFPSTLSRTSPKRTGKFEMNTKYLQLQLKQWFTSEKKPQIFSISYRSCTDSKHYCFSVGSSYDNLVVDNILIVYDGFGLYVNKEPFEISINDSFICYVDFTKYSWSMGQSIILTSHLKDNRETYFIEEHHFIKSSETDNRKKYLPNLSQNSTFRQALELPDYLPPFDLKEDLMYERFMNTSSTFNDYIQNGKKLLPQNIGKVLTKLLQLEDMNTIKEYLTQKSNLLQFNIRIYDGYSPKEHKRMYWFDTPRGVNTETLLSDLADVIITTERIQKDPASLYKFIFQTKEQQEEKKMLTYVGIIDDIDSGRIYFKCVDKINLSFKYMIAFRPSRLQIRYQYYAMEVLSKKINYLKQFLFPEGLVPKATATICLDLYNKSIYGNPEQLHAVKNIAEGPRNDAAYILNGPPGTGKTTTLAECVLQVLKKSETKVLITASSNAACDEVALRVCQTLAPLGNSSDILRVFAKSRESHRGTIDDLLLEHSNMYGSQFYPDVHSLHRYRVVICTVSVVAKLATSGFGGVYTHLFIDEVAASTEVEAIMTMTSIMRENTRFIISGDNKQLGPIIKSKLAEKLNLGVSLMDRLLERDCYRVNRETKEYDRTIQTRLRLNFRSHPAIVNLYSNLYYNGDLQAKAKIEEVSLARQWHLSLNDDYPILFHSIEGKSYNDERNCSWYNDDEVNTVMAYVKDLMYFGINGRPVLQRDIGVISPYKSQYQRIRKELDKRKMHHVQTGSVEIFQGQEKDIIIACFVRSNTPTLGFLQNPRRLNVTLSRAKSLLILIGNAETLSKNSAFLHIINKCRRHHTFKYGMDIITTNENKENSTAEMWNRCANRNSRKNTKEASRNVSKQERRAYNSHNKKVL